MAAAHLITPLKAPMNDLEALMWALDGDPVMRSSFASLSFLDRPVDLARFQARMQHALRVISRLGQRVMAASTPLANPYWDNDPLFDLGFHVRRIAAPSPGTDRDVLDLATAIYSDSFDRARPLWQFTLIDGLAGGRGALVQKIHHTIADGEGGVRMSATFVDLERDAVSTVDVGESLLPESPPPPPAPRSPPSVMSRAGDPLYLARRSTGMARAALSMVGQLAAPEKAISPLWTQRSLGRRLEVTSIDFKRAKAASKVLGGTINDVLVTGVCGAAGAYHLAQGVEVGDLRMAMPISTRREGVVGNNAFIPSRVLAPAGILDPVARFREVKARLTVTKQEGGSRPPSWLAGVLARLPSALQSSFARQQVGSVDFTVSNVRSAPFDIYIAGAKVEANYAMGPLAGTAFNLTMLSSAGQLDLGCVIDTAAVSDPGLLRSCLVKSFDELLSATGT